MRKIVDLFFFLLLPSAALFTTPSARGQVPYTSQPALTSNQLLIGLNQTIDPVKKRPLTAAEFGRKYNLAVYRTLSSDPQMAVLNFKSPAAASAALSSLITNPFVRQAGLNVRHNVVPCAFVANDPLIAKQNHLVTTNTIIAWNKNITGQGVTIGIIDDGVERTHEDLAHNYRASDSYDFLSRDIDPSPVGSNNHGTSVAGLAAARGGNGIGVSGTAPFANLAGLRIGYGGASTVADFVDAVKYHSTGVLRTIAVKNHSYGIAAPFVDNSLESQAFTDSATTGTIHIVSAGNERKETFFNQGDCNKASVASNPNVITVAALLPSGKFTSYSSYGSCVTISATAHSSNTLGVVTTDRMGDPGYNLGSVGKNYTTFNGTSAAAPVVSGIVALAKQVNPKLSTRTLKHLLARYSIINDPFNFEWITNAAGFHFNPNYGFGLINADQLTQNAPLYVATPQAVTTTATINVNAALDTSLTRSVIATNTSPLEEVQISLVMSGSGYRGTIRGTLISPSGTTSVFCAPNLADDRRDFISWKFTSNAFWGENPAGNWQVIVDDDFAIGNYTWKSFQLTFRSGTLVDAPPPENDNFADAFVLSSASFTASGVTYKATDEVGEPAHAGLPAEQSVWWKWKAPKTGRVLLKTDSSLIDTVLAVYTGNSVDALTEVASNNNYNGETSSGLAFTATAGVTYYIAIDSADGTSGPVTLLGSYLPNLKISAADGSATEPGRDTGIIYISRQDSLTLPINLVLTVNGTATAGADYKSIELVQTIPAGQYRTAIPVVVLDDILKETVETVTINLDPSIEYDISGATSATVEIYDNER